MELKINEYEKEINSFNSEKENNLLVELISNYRKWFNNDHWLKESQIAPRILPQG